ncbi:hypothetical protein N7474_008224 [Penicillium riverlandense]|uniref:uncharacterized protein n=1 Tax=Penicillium riverlandense TaxID=1903569 RepID=UPI002548A1B5|nr:uncharacterized protein N7474_008224 [Penicillium riverlandense]KAJ5811923.1 hypothetical protein N7474_008224 [Penicillium riverlandense]
MKGLFVGGIPLALLAAAAQAQFDGPTGDLGAPGDAGLPFPPQPGGPTLLGGPSGNDKGDAVGSITPNVHTNSDVNEWSKDDHSIDVKDKDVYPPPVPWEEPVTFLEGPGPVVPGLGPFKKRHWPSGGTAIGGPSGDDEGQSFDMPITGNFHTDVNEFNHDDHSIKVKHKDIHEPPYLPPGPPPFAPGAPPFASPDFEGPPSFGGHEAGPIGAPSFGGPPSGLEDPEGEFGIPPVAPKRDWDPEEWGPQEDVTALGGPSGNDGGQSFSAPETVDTHTGVNEFWDDNHAINVKDKDVYPSPPLPPFPGPEANSPPSFEAPPPEAPAPEAPAFPEAATTGDAPSAPPPAAPAQDQFGETIPGGDITPFRSGTGNGVYRRAYAPDSSRESSGGQSEGQNAGENAGQNGANGGATLEGGPSGNDGGNSISGGGSVSTDTHVDEHHQDNHAIKADVTHVHPPPEVYYGTDVYPDTVTSIDNFPPSELEDPAYGPPSGETPPTFKSKSNPPREDVDHATECAASVHEVVRTVTKTHYRQVEKTATVYTQRPATSMIVETSAIPMAAVPQHSDVPQGKVYSNPAPQPSMETVVAIPASSSMVPVYSYDYQSHRPVTKGMSYSMIPVDVPVASSSMVMGSSTPVTSQAVPTGVSPEFSASASASSSARAHMFTGDAPRLSGGLVSVAAAVMGVLAFIL